MVLYFYLDGMFLFVHAVWIGYNEWFLFILLCVEIETVSKFSLAIITGKRLLL